MQKGRQNIFHINHLFLWWEKWENISFDDDGLFPIFMDEWSN